MRSAGAQPAKLYGLAKVQSETRHCALFRQARTTTGSPYHNLNKFLTSVSKRVSGANIETSSLQARELESVELEENEQIIFLDFKNFQTNAPVFDAIEIALRSSYSSDNTLDIERSTLKLKLTRSY